MVAIGIAGCSDSLHGSDAGVLEIEEPSGTAVLIDDRMRSGDGATCERGTSIEIDLDDETELGFSANDVLAYAGGTRRAPLTWDSDDALVTLEPARGSEELAIRVQPRSDRALFHDPEVESIGHGAQCRSWIEIDVDVIVQSTSRALHESFEATLFTESLGATFLAATTQAPQLQGSLRAERSGEAPIRTDLHMTFSPFGVTGSLRAVWAGTTRPSPQLAFWGQRPCDRKQFSLSPEQQLEGVASGTLLEMLEMRDTIALEWLDGSRTTATLRFEADYGGAACAYFHDWVGGEGVSLELTGTVEVASEDGRLGLRAPVPLSTSIDPDFTGFWLSELGNPANTTAEELGFAGIDGSAFQPLHRQLFVQLDAQGTPSGDIGLYGIRKLSCMGSGPDLFCEERTEQLESATVGP
jgi:hypothetical protein